MSHPAYAYLDDRVVPWDEARVHVSSVAFKFGTAVFEGIRGYWSPEHEEMFLFRLDDHLERLRFSQAFMRFEAPIEPAVVRRAILEVVRANALREDVHIMATVYVRGPGGPAVSGPVGLAVTAAPRLDIPWGETGCRVQVSSWQRVEDRAMPVRVKCNANYQNGRLAAVQARADGYDTALLLNARGKIAEGPGMCFFMVRDGRALTSTVTSDILESITRATLLELIPTACGIPCVERDLDRSELAAASEAFFCGTAWEVTPIVAIDGLPVGAGVPGPVVRALRAAYFDLVRGASAAHPEWRTPVYGEEAS
ncbi:MAG: branched-chain amino acid aminotransferase [Bacteroidetes bacterium]|nr:MAG: branched-chain amino acid aminotransferase [Bacteroidota bacterium]